ncbi:hypothetical protein Taro_054862 [Colocasia esculenta]|uniref:Uncharacterized protein n=1 Tax=Colocasia esculenta TaxID=4460 RepID=A0A843XSI7_COLES|nr:hypothetical protein [Colocasia esculenta]
MGLRQCGPQVWWFGWSPQFFGFTCGCGAVAGPYVRGCETERSRAEAAGSRPGHVELLGGGGKLCRPGSGAEARAAGVLLEPGQLARWSCEGSWVRAAELGRWAAGRDACGDLAV